MNLNTGCSAIRLGVSDQCMNLNTHLYLVLRLRVHGAIPQCFLSSWYGA